MAQVQPQKGDKVFQRIGDTDMVTRGTVKEVEKCDLGLIKFDKDSAYSTDGGTSWTSKPKDFSGGKVACYDRIQDILPTFKGTGWE